MIVHVIASRGCWSEFVPVVESVGVAYYVPGSYGRHGARGRHGRDAHVPRADRRGEAKSAAASSPCPYGGPWLVRPACKSDYPAPQTAPSWLNGAQRSIGEL